MSGTQTLVGVDGCKVGWLAVSQSHDEPPKAGIYPTFAALIEAFAGAAWIAVDIPIGLPRVGSRACDIEARREIQPRGSSVFPAPIRGVLDARGEAANRLHREIDGRGLTLQAAAILLKIQEVDLVLQRTPDLHRQVIEVHPELSFKFWKGTPLDHPKRRSAGKSERRVLVDALWPGAVAAAEERLGRKKGRWGTDDLLDAFAALWTARRVVQGVSVEFPRTPESDELGTPMRMFA